ncbi:MAG: hypothetical protein JST87_05365 [Bacteroidetes bacterium]|nr:hypothetical protein [Bacteroidota bacterium]
MTPDCNKHKKEVAGVSDMKVLAEMIGDLHYEALSEFFEHLCDKITLDAAKDRANGRKKLADELDDAAAELLFASVAIEQAWNISKPFMQTSKPPHP